MIIQNRSFRSFDRRIVLLQTYGLFESFKVYSLFSYQGSVLSLLCDSLFSLAYRFDFVKHFFIFLFDVFRLHFIVSANNSFILSQVSLFVKHFFIFIFLSNFAVKLLRCYPPFSAGEDYNNTYTLFCQHYFYIFLFYFFKIIDVVIRPSSPHYIYYFIFLNFTLKMKELNYFHIKIPEIHSHKFVK